MTKRVTSIVTVAALALAGSQSTEAFAPTTSFVPISTGTVSKAPVTFSVRLAEQATDAESAEVTPLTPDTPEEDDTLAMVEKFGRGSAKAKRGSRKGGSAAPAPTKAAVTLAPEETFYEGPPAITETIAPTLSILTVVGIVPAAAAWARQAWVRYKITSRRIRVTSGIGGKDMAEIVYPDIVEIRTAKRLFGDGDMVAFLRDGAKFEMRNIPDFEATMEFILKQVDPSVAKAYRAKGDVTQG